MTEEKKVKFLMHGVKNQFFASLMHQLPKTIVEFTQEASMIEKTVDIPTRQYYGFAQVCAIHPATTTTTSESLWAIIWEIVCEEVR